VERFHRALKGQGLAVSRDTLHQVLGHLEDCFLVRLTWMEARSERQRMVNPRKIHPVDPGLIPVFDRSGKASLGHALESAVRVELERRRADVHYVRTPDGFEVRALLAAGELRPRAARVLLTLTPESARDVPDSIAVHDAARWLAATEA